MGLDPWKLPRVGSCSPGKILDKHRLLNKQRSPRWGLLWTLNAFDLFIVLEEVVTYSRSTQPQCLPAERM